MIPVVLSGGSGTRLWPVSRASWPKPFCDLFDESLYVKTLKRLLPLGSPWTVTVQALQARTREACRQVGLPETQVIYEPLGRNTAPAIALACRLFALRGKGGDVVGIFPADHLVQDAAGLQRAVELGAEYAAKGEVVALGMTPTRPAVTFGYLETADNDPMREAPRVLTARRFVEKPPEATARRLLAAGNCLWNAGIFLFRVDAMIGHFQSLLPDLWRRIETIDDAGSNLASVYEAIEPLSFDHGILERLDSLLCIPCDVGWSDVGSWEEVSALSNDTPDARVFTAAAANNYVYPQTSKVYGLAGVDDLIIVDTGDALLVTRQGQGTGYGRSWRPSDGKTCPPPRNTSIVSTPARGAVTRCWPRRVTSRPRSLPWRRTPACPTNRTSSARSTGSSCAAPDRSSSTASPATSKPATTSLSPKAANTA